jgi:hypothetical protein
MNYQPKPRQPDHVGKYEHLESSLDVASFLLAKRHALVGLEPVGKGRFAFRFDDADGSSETDARSFYMGATCEAQSFAESLKRLKSLLYTEKDMRNGNGKNNYRRN